jgi:hypothetical protein
MAKIIWLCAIVVLVCLARAETSDVDEDVLSVDDLSSDAWQERQSRRRKNKIVIGTPPGVDVDPADDDVAVNDFAKEAGRTYDFTQLEKDKPPATDDTSSSHRKSKKEQWQQRRDEYHQHQGSTPVSESTTKLQCAYGVEKTTSKRVTTRAAYLRDELQHYLGWLRNRSQSQEVDTGADEMVQLRQTAIARMPLPLVSGRDLAHIRTVVDGAEKRIAKLIKDMEELGKTVKGSPLGEPADAAAAGQAMDAARKALAPLERLLSDHAQFHRSLADASLASSEVSAGLAKGQLEAAAAAMERIRKEDDAGVGNADRRRQRNDVKALHKHMQTQIEMLAAGRRAAQQHLAANVPIDRANLETLVFANALARTPPASIVATSYYDMPIVMSVTGFTLREIAAMMGLVAVPFQACQLCFILSALLQRAWRYVTRRQAKVHRRFPGQGQNLRGDTRHTALSVFRNAWVRFAFNLLLSGAAMAVAGWLLANSALPALPHATPSALWFTFANVITATQRFVVGSLVVALHFIQVRLSD